MNFKLVSNTRGARARSAFIILLLLLSLYTIFNFIHHKTVHREDTLQKYIIFKRLSPNTKIKFAFKLKKTLEKINSIPHVWNLNKFTPILDETPVLVIQVNKDIIRLQYLITSLSQVQNINTVLLIFSQTYYDVNLNILIRSIDFCKVMQIFYTHSLQLNPKRFPGVDPDDCKPSLHNPRTTRHCLVRDARLIEHKQHWWWKINFVFEHMQAIRTNEFPIIFLEEDSYVFPDLLYMLQYAQRSFQYFPQVEVISFGRPSPSMNLDTDLCVLEPWRPIYRVGIALNRTTWKKMLSTASGYCMYNDNSWSYSLFNLFRQFPRGFASSVKFEVPRVISTREYDNISEIHKVSQRLSKFLFPSKVKAVFLVGPGGRVEAPHKPPKGSGNWNDLRDQLLCLDPLTHTTTEEPRYYDMYETSEKVRQTNISKH